MYLVDQARVGKVLPAKLPPDLVPPSYRRARSGSGVGGAAGVAVTSPPGQAAGAAAAAAAAAAPGK